MKTGGSQTLAVDLLNELCHHNDVSLIIINNQYSEYLLNNLNPKIKVYKIERKEGSRSIWPILKINHLINKINPDVVHAHENKIVNLLKFIKAKTIYTIHDVDIPTTNFAKYNALVAISNTVSKNVFDRLGVHPQIIYNGILFDRFLKRHNYKLNHLETIKLIQISRLVHEKKGQDIIIRAFSHLLKDITLQKKYCITLDLVGSGPSQPYLENLAQTLGVSKFVNFLGEKDRSWIGLNLSNYHSLIQPSRYEGFGLTVVESIAAGVPVLASNIEGPAEILKDVPAGYLFKAEDVDDCVRMLKVIIENYKEDKIQSQITAGYNLLFNKYSIKQTAQNYLKAYEGIN
jgi:glycosyltransferase involved in cell wall biosynthesis